MAALTCPKSHSSATISPNTCTGVPVSAARPMIGLITCQKPAALGQSATMNWSIVSNASSAT